MTGLTTTDPAAAFGPPDDPTLIRRDFTLREAPLWFKIGSEHYAAPPIVSGVVIARVAGLMKQLRESGIDDLDFATLTEQQAEAAIALLADALAVLVGGRYGARIKERMLVDGVVDGVPPISLTDQAMPILTWLMEEYGLRPTPQSSPLPSDSTTGDLTDGAPVEVSTGEESATPLNS